MDKRFVKIIILLLVLFALFGCEHNTEMITKVNVYEMKSFSTVKEDSIITYTDASDIRKFAKGFKGVKKEAGYVNMVDPDYKVELGDERFFLWINEDYATIMNHNDTYTIYSLSKNSAKAIHNLLRKD